MDESGLVARAREGDGEAFNELVQRHQGLLYSVAYRILGNAQDAADATQDAFLSAYRAMLKFRGGSLKAWLVRIVTNACDDCLRRAKSRPVIVVDHDEEMDWPECLPDPGELPEAWVERGDLGQQIQRALMALSPKQRIVVVLSDLQGMHYAEIAQVLRIPLGTVRSRLNRGRRTLRNLLLDPAGLASPDDDSPAPRYRHAVVGD